MLALVSLSLLFVTMSWCTPSPSWIANTRRTRVLFYPSFSYWNCYYYRQRGENTWSHLWRFKKRTKDICWRGPGRQFASRNLRGEELLSSSSTHWRIVIVLLERQNISTSDIHPKNVPSLYCNRVIDLPSTIYSKTKSYNWVPQSVASQNKSNLLLAKCGYSDDMNLLSIDKRTRS